MAFAIYIARNCTICAKRVIVQQYLHFDIFLVYCYFSNHFDIFQKLFKRN